jgi:toxin ParE1/3/4
VKLRYTPRATQDLAEIAEYLRLRNPAAALTVRGAILRSLQDLALFPEIGHRQDVEGVRKPVTRRYQYLIYYTVDERAEEVLARRERLHPRARAAPPDLASWSWRDELANGSWWSLELKREAMAAGAEALWPTITAG